MGFLKKINDDAEKESIVTENLDDVDMSDFEIPEEHREILDSYLKKFLLFKNDTVVPSIDITLMIKALPNRTNEYNVALNEMFNFRVFQESLIAFQNQEMVLAFEYFDLKNSERVFEVQRTIDRQKKDLGSVATVLELMQKKLEREENFYSTRRRPSLRPSGGF